jgi:glycosyltransferase involved in cell wall biosynthesis
MQGGAIELARQIEDAVAEQGPPAALLVTDMVNLPALIALIRPRLDRTPILYYAHENQLTYPPPPGEKRDLTYGMINTLSMLSADAIAFNSQYHLDTFFDELPRLLKHFPDYNHLEIIPLLRQKSQVIPVGIALPAPATPPVQPRSGPIRILWNQRWEYDKNPRDFFAALYRLQAEKLPFQVIVAGENFRQKPQEFAEAKRRLGEHVLHWGYVPKRADYVRLLQEADVVISTAIHEFFGISILEAIAAGCYPLLPHRLSYPELIPVHLHDEHLYEDFADLVAKLRRAVLHPELVRNRDRRSLAAAYAWPQVAPRYDAVLAHLSSHGR